MKKVLLFACMAVATLSASAQIKGESYLSKMARVCSPMKVAEASAPVANPTSADKATIMKSLKRAASHDGIYGLYIQSSTGLSDSDPACDSIYVEKANLTQDGVTYNVKFTIPSASAPLSYYGVYDEASKKITCLGGQYCGEYINTASAVDFKLYVCAMIGNDFSDLSQVQISDDAFTYSVEDDGIYLDELGLYIGIENQDSYWSVMGYQTLKPANAVMSFVSQYFGDEPVVNAVSVDNLLTTYNIYGFAKFANSNGLGLSPVASFDVDDEYSATMKAGMNFWDATMFMGTSYDSDSYGKWFKNYGITFGTGDQEGYVLRDDDLDNGKDYGFLKDENTLAIQPFPVLSNFVADPATGEKGAYGTWLQKITVTMTDGSFVTGINNVNAVKTAKDNKVYNMLGQRVAANTKGLVICNGKKYINK